MSQRVTAMGNALVQAMALGVIRKPADARSLIRSASAITEFQPRDAETWARAFQRYRAVVK